MTRDQLVAEISRLLNDVGGTRWDPTITIIPRLDAAQIDVQKYAKAVKTTSSYTPTAGVAAVVIGGATGLVIDVLRATYTLSDGTILTEKNGFKPISRWDLDFMLPNWPNMTPAQPQMWFVDASSQAVVLVPAPDAGSIVANALTLLEVRQPTAISAGTGVSVPFDNTLMMVPFHRALIYWVVAECMRDNNDADSLAKAKYFRSDNRQQPGLYETEIKQILSLFDVPEAIPAAVRFQPQGGRISGNSTLNQKSNPLFYA